MGTISMDSNGNDALRVLLDAGANPDHESDFGAPLLRQGSDYEIQRDILKNRPSPYKTRLKKAVFDALLETVKPIRLNDGSPFELSIVRLILELTYRETAEPVTHE